MPRPSSYLGTPQRQISDSRISRINKLFEAKLKDDSMVVSNNSTSVVNDICQPVSLPEDTTIKQSTLNDFKNKYSESPKEENFINVTDEEERNNLQFTPRLRSKQSIIELSKTNTPRNENRTSKKKSLKDILGNPLPLPYLDNQNDIILGKDLNSRWKTILSNTKSIESKPINSKESKLNKEMRPNLHGSKPVTIEDRLKENAQKLDEIIDLLKKNNVENRHDLYEPLIWLTCIILLIFCNIWVYYYV